MKKLILVVSLVAAAVMVAPVASASAAEAGHCKIYGKAVFSASLPFAVPAERGFTFTAEKLAGNLEETLKLEESGCFTGTEFKKLTSATVSGTGEIACVVANGVANANGTVKGAGEININNSGAKKFKFEFVAVGANVAVVVTEVGKDEVNATGDAEFLSPGNTAEKEQRLKKCEKGETLELPFEAVVAGTL